MKGLEVYQLYVSLKIHFSQETYWYNKFGVRPIKYETYIKRNDRWFFEKIARDYSGSKEGELVNFLVANFMENQSFWIGDSFTNVSEDVYHQWQKRIESLTYTFTSETKKLMSTLESYDLGFNSLFAVPNNGSYPNIFISLMQHDLSLETFIILDRILGFLEPMNAKIGTNDVVWKSEYHKIIKYAIFVPGKEKNREFKEILKNHVREFQIKE
jgi:hypothetical protein